MAGFERYSPSYNFSYFENVTVTANEQVVASPPATLGNGGSISADGSLWKIKLLCAELVEKLRPGQFIELSTARSDLLLRRPLSVFRCNQQTGELSILYQVKGSGTQALANIQVGGQLSLIGPLGNGWPTPGAVVAVEEKPATDNPLASVSMPQVVPAQAQSGNRLLLIGGGIGIAPLGMLAEQLARSAPNATNAPKPANASSVSNVTIIQSAKTANRLVEAKFFRSQAAAEGNYQVATDDGSAGYAGLVTGLVAQICQQATRASAPFTLAYVCGPEPMQQAVVQVLDMYNIPTFVSLERLMACGIGACLSCVVSTGGGPKRVCADGPIFDAKEVNWHDIKTSRV